MFRSLTRPQIFGPLKSFSKTITVSEEHLDELNHVNNVVYLQWVQDIAKDHWFSLVEDTFTKDHFWMVVKHELEYKKQAFLGDVLFATTYVESFKGPFSIRCVEFKRGEELIVKTRSNWCMVKRQTEKPKWVPEEVSSLFI